MVKDKLLRHLRSLELDLKGQTVLTEAATGAYIVTPVLAALAGARVLAYAKSTRYGTQEEVFEQTRKFAAQFDRPLDITYLTELTPEVIGQADVITNSGHLRPLNRELLQHAKDSAVISLMYEAWEMRDADIDAAYVRERGFRFGATNERHPAVDVFNYLGDMCVKMIFDAGINPYGNDFVLVCNNDFGPFLAKVVSKVCRKLGVIDKAENRSKYDGLAIDWLADFPQLAAPGAYRDAEAIIFTASPFEDTWIGNGAVLPPEAWSVFSDPYILRFAGHIDTPACDAAGIRYHPAVVKAGHMGIIPSEIGWDPIMRLQAGGLKVAELLLRGETEFQGQPLLERIH